MIPQTPRVILMIKQHASRYICSSLCSLLQCMVSTLHTLTTIYRVSMSFSSNRHSEGKYITTSHCYIHDGSQRNILLCGRSCDDMISASFKFLGKQPTQLCLGLASLLEIDASFVPALRSSHGLEGTAAPKEIWSCFYSKLGRSEPEAPV